MMSDERMDPAASDPSDAGGGNAAPRELPDPAGPPVPVSRPSATSFGAMSTLMAVLAGGGVAFVMLAGQTTTREGATRSATLQWQARQLQIEQAIEAEQASAAEPEATAAADE